MTNSQIIDMHAMKLQLLLIGGIQSETEVEAVCYYINKIGDMHELMHCHHNPEVPNPHKDLLEEADDALITWKNCQNHIDIDLSDEIPF